MAPLVFLDRDGTINRFPGEGKYVTKVSEFRLLPGAARAIKALNHAGCKVFVISNQAGVGRGIFTQQKLNQIDVSLHRQIGRQGARIIKSFYCTHHPDEGCDCRKPGIGNIKKALRLQGASIREARRAFFVGDTEIDIKTGRNAGCRTILVLSGRDKAHHAKGWSIKPDYIVDNLKQAAQLIIYENMRHPRHRRSRA